MNPLKILVSTSNSYARHGIGQLLRNTAEHMVLCGNGSWEELSRLVRDGKPDLVIADVSGRPQDWKMVASLAPAHRVLVIVDSVRAFGNAYPDWPLTEVLGCDGHPGEILRWIEVFEQEGRLRLEPLRLQLVDETGVEAPAQPVSITPREREIMELVRQGCCNKRIAKALSISITTVRTHRYKMMTKLGLHNAVEIARYAERFDAQMAVG
ncbi:response regulator transcription factor [Acidovorax sp. sic0104]|uniref:response regulator transcription factor n=1 Tax=Acidovorax sp. sic0104 TaxID=2854784 RepID=UPI001C4692FD|nr:response regulator transcription factor [Acidovorax sp. sic0104]MBV7539798.1 response regulator transcription factor [Acidovorax sp. sic0104]